MQVIWSRVAQTRSCACTLCLHSTTTIARRTTTAAGKRRLKFNDVFTACYSAMFATAALVDLKYKEDRRNQWDKAIEEAKRGSHGAITVNSTSAPESTVQDVDLDYVESKKSIKFSTSLLPDTRESGLASSAALSAAKDFLNWSSDIARQETHLEEDLKVLDRHVQETVFDEDASTIDLLDNGIITSSNDKCNFAARLPTKAIHLRRMEQMVARLVSELLLNLQSSPVNETGVSSSADVDDCHNKQMNNIICNIASMRTRGTQLPSYSTHKEAHNGANYAISRILSPLNPDPGMIDLMVAKICYNLLLSAAPPSIATYTLMIHHFTRVKQHRLAQVVINSFLYDSKFRPNENTIAAILDHYAAIGDRDGFASMVRRMRGGEGNFRIRRRHVSELVDPVVQSLAVSGNVAVIGEELHWRVRRTEKIFNSLVRGSLQLHSVTRAVEHFISALREGCRVATDVFIKLTEACLDSQNTGIAVKVLYALLAEWKKTGDLGYERYASARVQIYKLMQHSGGCEKLDDITENSTRPLSLKIQEFRAWFDDVRLESINQTVNRAAKLVSKLEGVISTGFDINLNPQEIVLRVSESLDDHCEKYEDWIVEEVSALQFQEYRRQLRLSNKFLKTLEPFWQQLHYSYLMSKGVEQAIHNLEINAQIRAKQKVLAQLAKYEPQELAPKPYGRQRLEQSTARSLETEEVDEEQVKPETSPSYGYKARQHSPPHIFQLPTPRLELSGPYSRTSIYPI
jgi:hypothetical protein